MTNILQDASKFVAQETAATSAEVQEVLHQVQKIAESTAERLQDLADGVMEQTRERLEQGARIASEHPIALIGSALAIGIAIGLLLPRK